MGFQFVALDVETANASEPGSICAVGAVRMTDGVLSDQLYTLIQPQTIFSAAYTQVHGLTQADVEGAPLFQDFWPTLRAFIGNDPVVAHNAAFDCGAVHRALERAGVPCPAIPFTCTYRMAKRVMPRQGKYSLDALAASFGLDMAQHHNALSDALACGQIAVLLSCMAGCESLDAQAWRDVSITLDAPPVRNEATPEQARRRAVSGYLYQTQAHGNDFAAMTPLQTDFFVGKKVVFTGDMAHLSRTDAQSLVEALGGACTSAVSGKTDVLVVGAQNPELVVDGKSGKQRKAEELIARGKPLRILDEGDFYEAVYGVRTPLSQEEEERS